MSSEDLKSLIVTDPDLVDPELDVSGLRTQTDTDPRLLASIADFPGISYDPTQFSYLTDLNELFAYGLPVVDTSTTTPDTGTGGGDTGDGGQATLPGFDVDSPKNTPEEQRLIDEGIGVQIGPGDPVVAPGEIPVTQAEIDAFNQIPVTPVGRQPIDPTGMLPQIPEVVAQDPTTMLPQLGSISPTFAEGTATLEDAGGTYPIIGDDIGVLQSAEGGLGEEVNFTPLQIAEASETTFGTPVDVEQGFTRDFSAPGTLADPLEKMDFVTEESAADPGFLSKIGLGQFNPAEAFVKAAINKAIGLPVTFLIDLLKDSIPPQDPRVGALNEFYTTGAGAKYLDPSSPNYIPGMENYNRISGGFLNTITGGRVGDPTTYGLQEAYQDRIDTVEKTLQDKYGLSAKDIADIKAGTFNPEKMDKQTDLVQRLVNLEDAKAAEKKRLDLFSGDVDERDQMLEDLSTDSLQGKINLGIQAADDDKGSDMLDTATGVNQFADIDTGVGEFDEFSDEAFMVGDTSTAAPTTGGSGVDSFFDSVDTITGGGGGRDRDPDPSPSFDPGQGFVDTGGGGEFDTTPSKPSGPNYGPPSQSGGGGGGGGGGQNKSGCVIATHAVNSGAFTKDTKREAVRWCVKNLHRTWWGEAIRRGYRYYGQKAIEEGKAKNHYQEFKDYVAFGTGKRRTLKTGWTFVYRSIQFFIRGLING